MKIPAGYELYQGPANWKLILGAQFWDARFGRWCQVSGGAFATGQGPLIVPNTKVTQMHSEDGASNLPSA